MFVDHLKNPIKDKNNLYRYLSNIPLPDLVIYVKADLLTCQKRMMQRPDGLTDRLKKADSDVVRNFLVISQNHLDSVNEWLTSTCSKKLVEVDNENGYEDCIDDLIEKIQGM